ncbi:unnamed protein product [Arctogadus glacialis]
MAAQLSMSLVGMEEESSSMQNKREPPTAVPPGLPVEVSRKSGRLNPEFTSDTQPSDFLASSHIVNSLTIHPNICSNKKDSMEEMSGNTETCLPGTTGDQATPVVVRRKRGRPRKRKNRNPYSQPARPMDCNVPVHSKVIDGLGWPHNEESISNELIATTNTTNGVDSLTVITATQSQTTYHSDSVSEPDNSTEKLRKKVGRPRKQRLTSLASSPVGEADGAWISTEDLQPVASRDPNKSHLNTLECSRYGRKRSLKLHFKIFKMEQEDEPEDSLEACLPRRKKVRRFHCKMCDRSYQFKSQFIQHELSHVKKPFLCRLCGIRFGKESNLTLHLKNQHKSHTNSPKSKKHIQCSKYSDHVEKEYENLNQDSDFDFHQSVAAKQRKGMVCLDCGKQFAYHSALQRHMHVHTGAKPHKCDVCGKGFCQHYFLCVHQLTHWSENRYNCLDCFDSFTEFLKAKNHVCRSVKSGQGSRIPGRSKVSLSYTCDICKKTFFILKDFHLHVKAHSSAKLYHCLMCGKLFSFQSEYNAHQYYCKKRRAENKSAVKFSTGRRSELLFTGPNSMPSVRASTSQGDHSSNMPLQSLQIHPKEFVVSNNPFHSTVIPQTRSPFVSKLNNLDNRSDPRKYLCPHCGRLFRHMGRLRAHMLTHAQGQSYTCGCCGKTLDSWTKLWHHQRVHRQKQGRFTCPECGQGFRFAEPYKRHMAGHPEYQWIQRKSKKVPLPYQCELCCTSFETLDLLFSHQSCHFSGVRKVKPFHSSLDGHSPERALSLPVNHHLSHSEPQCSTMDISLSAPAPSLLESVALQYPNQIFHASKVCDVSPEDIRCVVCGSCYPGISELYLHYLQHARGQL